MSNHLQMILREKLYYSLQGEIQTIVTQQVKVASNQTQVPEAAHNLSYYVYFMPNVTNYTNLFNIPKNTVLTEASQIKQPKIGTKKVFHAYLRYLESALLNCA